MQQCTHPGQSYPPQGLVILTWGCLAQRQAVLTVQLAPQGPVCTYLSPSIHQSHPPHCAQQLCVCRGRGQTPTLGLDSPQRRWSAWGLEP